MTVHIEDEGHGEPVVLAHAGVTDRRVWDAAVSTLVAAGYRVIRYDLPGYGLSPRPGPAAFVRLGRSGRAHRDRGRVGALDRTVAGRRNRR